MITEDYVSFEIAKLLKEKGFDEDIDLWYDEKGDKFFKYHYEIKKDWRVQQNQQVYQCPTLQMAMKWLREIHHLFISIFTFDYQLDSYGWMFLMKPLRYLEGVGWCCDSDRVQEKKWSDDKVYKTYEEACDAAIKYCLENLI